MVGFSAKVLSVKKVRHSNLNLWHILHKQSVPSKDLNLNKTGYSMYNIHSNEPGFCVYDIIKNHQICNTHLCG